MSNTRTLRCYAWVESQENHQRPIYFSWDDVGMGVPNAMEITPGPRIFAWVDYKMQLRQRVLEPKEKRPRIKLLVRRGVKCEMTDVKSLRLVRENS